MGFTNGATASHQASENNKKFTPVKPIHLITDGGPLRLGGRLVWAVEQALKGADGEIAVVQIREQVEHQASDAEVVDLVKQLQPACKQYGAKLVVNRRLDLVGASGADGVQLGLKTVAVDRAREILGQQALIGYSAHSLTEVDRVSRLGVSYILYGPVFPPLSKTSVLPPCGSEHLKEVCSLVKVPIYAIGGITVDNIRECKLSGIKGVAVITSILGQDNPGKAAAELARSWFKG